MPTKRALEDMTDGEIQGRLNVLCDQILAARNIAKNAQNELDRLEWNYNTLLHEVRCRWSASVMSEPRNEPGATTAVLPLKKG